MYQPKGRLSTFVQGVWTASVPSHSSKPITRRLHSDACSGIIFNFNGDIYLDNTCFAPGVILLPVSKQAQTITLPAQSSLAGVRFHPAIGFGILGAIYDKPTEMQIGSNDPLLLNSLYARLNNVAGHYACMVQLYRWIDKQIGSSSVLPESLVKALNALQCRETPGQLGNWVPLSQRQLERLFKKWMGMSPKQYQRILRVRNTFKELKSNSDINLVELALSNGFSDQAHMTRESRKIEKITPGQYSKWLLVRE